MIYITGDTHCPLDIRKLNNTNFPQKSLTKDDYLIICGDAGFVWENRDKEDEYWQNWLDNKNFVTCFVDGNHENHNKLDHMAVEMWNGGKIHRLRDSVIHLMRGQIYTIDGYKFFAMGGAESTDKIHRTENESWWAREMPSDKEYEEAFNNLEKNNWIVDYVITHDAPTEVIQDLTIFNKPNKIRNFFSVIDSNLTYRQWFFGHHHQDLEIDNRHTLLYDKIIKIERCDMQEPIKMQQSK